MLHQTITPAADRRALEAANTLRIANLIAARAQGYQRAVLASAGKSTNNTDFALIELLDAVQHVCDGDVTETLADLCREAGVDEEGYPTNDDGDRMRGRDREVVIGGRF